MSNVTQTVESKRPDPFATLCGWPGVTVYSQDAIGGRIRIEYCGTAEDLVASGVATPEMLRINTPGGPRHRRIDADGDRYLPVSYWRSTDAHGQGCLPYRYFSLRRYKRVEFLSRLPGAIEAIAARERYQKWFEEQAKKAREILGWRESPDVEKKSRKPCPHLRLVVDNTPRGGALEKFGYAPR